MRKYLQLSGVFTLLFLLGTAGEGCKEGCDDVVCAPAPPALIVTVTDTLAMVDTIMVYDTTLMDSVVAFDTTTSTIKTGEAMVTLYGANGTEVGDSVATLNFNSSDTTYVLTDPSGLSRTDYALIASRGERRDTVTGLSIRSVEGCCGYDVIGVYKMALPER